jgi:transposase
MAAYSQDLRERVLSGLERGEGASAIARRLEVSVRWVYQVKDRYERHGERSAHKLGGYRRSRIAELEGCIRGWLKEQVDLTLVALSQRLAQQGVVIKTTALWHQLHKWELTFKKKLCTPASKSARTCRPHEGSGARLSPRLMSPNWYCWMKLG